MKMEKVCIPVDWLQQLSVHVQFCFSFSLPILFFETNPQNYIIARQIFHYRLLLNPIFRYPTTLKLNAIYLNLVYNEEILLLICFATCSVFVKKKKNRTGGL